MTDARQVSGWPLRYAAILLCGLFGLLIGGCGDGEGITLPPGSSKVVIQETGHTNDRLVWVFIAEGYTEGELDDFVAQVHSVADRMLSMQPWSQVDEMINIYAVRLPSKQSGADHPSSDSYVDTYFDGSYDSKGIARLLTVDASRAQSVAFKMVPSVDSVFVLVNDLQYGGSGGTVNVFSRNFYAPFLAMHENAHSFAGLADEYEDPFPGYPAGDHEPNVTFQTVRSHIPWNDLIASSTAIPTPEEPSLEVGLFEGARYRTSGIYRPQYTCMMRSILSPFCAVCQRAHLETIEARIGPLPPPKLETAMLHRATAPFCCNADRRHSATRTHDAPVLLH